MVTVTETNLPNLLHRGKVRDNYALGPYLLMVATDRISAFDVVLPSGIPGKGALLAQLSAFWFQQTAHLVPNHFVAMGYEEKKLASLQLSLRPGAGEALPLPPELARRSMVVKKADRIPVECVVRGYLTGSAWAEYQAHSTVGGLQLPPGLLESQELPETLFTPTTKADVGHDEPITLDEVARLVGEGTARQLQERSIAIYEFCRHYALQRNIVIADTKFEFGYIDGNLCLIDELLTPDSSRFWSLDSYRVGQPQDSLDKQLVRNWLLETGWDKEPPAPPLPSEVVEKTAQRYLEVFRILTDLELV